MTKTTTMGQADTVRITFTEGIPLVDTSEKGRITITLLRRAS